MDKEKKKTDKGKERTDSIIQESLAELEQIKKDLLLIQAAISHALEKVASAQEALHQQVKATTHRGKPKRDRPQWLRVIRNPNQA